MITFDCEMRGKVLDDEDKEILLRSAKDDAAREERLSRTALNPYFGEIISTALRSTEYPDRPTMVLLAAHIPMTDIEAMNNDDCLFVSCGNERGLLERMAIILAKDTRWCTYNGRGFDVPYARMRCLRYGIELPRKLVNAYRFSVDDHLDLADVLTGFGAMRQPEGGLAGLCRMLGIPSPKSDLDGAMVGEAWSRGEFFRVGRYCAQDTLRTEDVAVMTGYAKRKEMPAKPEVASAEVAE